MSEEILNRRLKPLENAPAGGLLIHEIYTSVQGESSYAGLPCTFIRTSVCHLRCNYCDTPHAFTQGGPMSLDEIMAQVKELGVNLVEVTGGEPLLQENVHPLMTQLCDEGYQVLIETSGACDISSVDSRVVQIMDLKTPSSGEVEANLWSNIDHLRSKDEVKFVIGDREDYDWCKRVMEQHDLSSKCTLLMGTIFGRLEPQRLVDWIVQDRLAVRMQLQMHKYIWEPKARGV